MAAVTVEKLSKRFGRSILAVDSVDLEIINGEFLTLLGPSGCGKSTILRMVAGLEEPSSGEIRFDGSVVNHLDPAQRNVAMVFQSYALYPHMTIAENLGYPLKKRGMPRAEREAKIMETARLLKIDQMLDRKPRQLSGGQQQRVALGRAMIRDPAIYLFDEPLSNLDASLRAYMRREVIRLHSSIKTTMVFVTHDQVEAMTMSQRIGVMEGGRIRQLGTPQEIYLRPCNSFVAGFVGTPSMNMLEMEQHLELGIWRLVSPDLVIEPGANRPQPDGFEKRVIVGVRADDVELGHGDYKGEIVVVEDLGNEQIVTISIGSREIVARAGMDHIYRIGNVVNFQFKPEKLHYFSSSSGDRIPTA